MIFSSFKKYADFNLPKKTSLFFFVLEKTILGHVAALQGFLLSSIFDVNATRKSMAYFSENLGHSTTHALLIMAQTRFLLYLNLSSCFQNLC